MNPLPLTCQVNGDPSMAALERCAHSPAVMALLTDLRGQLARRIPEVGDVLGWELSPLNADDLSFLNTLLGEGEVSVRIQHPDGSESEIQETIFCGLWRVRHLHNRRLLTDRLEAGSAPLTLWQAATADTLPDDSLLPPPVAGLMNGLPLAHELLAHVRDPALQPHSINLTQLPLSEADRLFLARLCGHGNIRFASPGMAKAKSTPQHCAISGMCAVWTPLKGRCSIAMRFVLCRSWYWRPRKIWPIRASAWMKSADGWRRASALNRNVTGVRY